jgi:tryptophan synthase alpha subunit
MSDGPIIQHATTEALAAGVKHRRALATGKATQSAVTDSLEAVPAATQTIRRPA